MLNIGVGVVKQYSEWMKQGNVININIKKLINQQFVCMGYECMYHLQAQGPMTRCDILTKPVLLTTLESCHHIIKPAVL